LSLAGLDLNYLIALVTLLERTLQNEQERLLHRSVPKPFYRLTNGDGQEGRAWFFAAEAALWLHYKGYEPAAWFEALTQWPPVKRRLLFGQRIPLNILAPGSRLSTDRLKEIEKFYLRWIDH